MSKEVDNQRLRLRRFHYPVEVSNRLTHNLFRFPAKFHPPVVRELLRAYVPRNERVLDPFCGSGTLLVEAATLGIEAVGTDVDPLAVFVSRVKSKPLRVASLRRSASALIEALESYLPRNYEELMFSDISVRTMKQQAEDGYPAIPNLHHWFRNYVVADLSRIRGRIIELDAPESHREFFLLAFASIIRAASNADPVPVSGLEVTSYMKSREKAGRVVNPYHLIHRALAKSLKSMEDLSDAVRRPVRTSAYIANATQLSGVLRKRVGAVITSPPYHGAVDYYRRHQLEMYWLDLIEDHEERLELLSGYIGRPKVPKRHTFVSQQTTEVSKLVTGTEARIRAVDDERANAFRHYCAGMKRCFLSMSTLLDTGRNAILVVGHSSWNGTELNTSQLFRELASPHFKLQEQYWYPVKNRYMSYERRNGASIDKEYVLVFERS